MAERRPRVLIGIPSFGGIVVESQESYMGMCYRAGRDAVDFDFSMNIGYRQEQFRGRNRLVHDALGAGCSHILMLDDDMIVPNDLIPRLLAHDKDVIGALYYQRGGQYHPVIMEHIVADGMHDWQFIRHTDERITTNRGLHEVDVIGGACMLFKTDVFNKLTPPYFAPELSTDGASLGTDISVCNRLRNAGFQIYCDTTIELGHVGDNRNIITSRTIPHSARTMSKINDELERDLMDYLGMTKEQLHLSMIESCQREQRIENWGQRETWDEIRDYYETNDTWHILNLAYWNLTKNDTFKEWAFTVAPQLLDKHSVVMDYGAGLGHVGVGLAKMIDCNVVSIDFENSSTLKFVEWRRNQHDLKKIIVSRLRNEFITNTHFLGPQCDGVFMISVMDHLTKPYETIQWIAQQMKPGAFLVCEYAVWSDPDEEPQHLNRYDIQTFDNWMHEQGFSTSPEHHWLFFKN